MGVVAHNWMELGFGRTSTTSTAQATPRNLLGFKDGTRNLKAEQTDLLNRYIWVGREMDQPWLRGGSYLVARKIRMFVENWDRDYLRDQENVIGRAKVSGAPLSGGSEFSTPDFTANGADGPAIPADAHIRLASPEHNGGIHILRRGYSFTDGIDPQAGNAARWPVLHRVHAESVPVRQAPDVAGGPRPERVHPPHRQRRVRRPAGPASWSALR